MKDKNIIHLAHKAIQTFDKMGSVYNAGEEMQKSRKSHYEAMIALKDALKKDKSGE